LNEYHWRRIHARNAHGRNVYVVPLTTTIQAMQRLQ
jgi:hypothetical protein